MKSKFEFTTKSGKDIQLVVEYESHMGHAWITMTLQSEKLTPITEADMKAYVDGVLIDSCCDRCFWTVIDTRDGHRKIWGLPIGFADPEVERRYQAWIAGVVEEGSDADVIKYRTEERARMDAESLAAYEKTVRKAEAQKCIPTAEEAKRMMEWYNNVLNEGGEGYVPYIYNIDQYDFAKRKIEEIKARM